VLPRRYFWYHPEDACQLAFDRAGVQDIIKVKSPQELCFFPASELTGTPVKLKKLIQISKGFAVFSNPRHSQEERPATAQLVPHASPRVAL